MLGNRIYINTHFAIGTKSRAKFLHKRNRIRESHLCRHLPYLIPSREFHCNKKFIFRCAYRILSITSVRNNEGIKTKNVPQSADLPFNLMQSDEKLERAEKMCWVESIFAVSSTFRKTQNKHSNVKRKCRWTEAQSPVCQWAFRNNK